MSRFKVIEGSLLGHQCCFTATIVDTEGNGVEDYDNVICDLVTIEWANTVATLLNNYVSQNNSNMDFAGDGNSNPAILKQAEKEKTKLEMFFERLFTLGGYITWEKAVLENTVSSLDAQDQYFHNGRLFVRTRLDDVSQ